MATVCVKGVIAPFKNNLLTYLLTYFERDMHTYCTYAQYTD